MIEDTTSPHRRSPADEVAALVGARVVALQGAYLPRRAGDTPAPHAAATMARLRRARPGDAGSDPATWGVAFETLPDDLLGHGDDPSRAERAVHAALVLYAVHQQSSREPMHVRGRSLGDAVRVLARKRDPAALDEAVLKRFHTVGTARSFDQAMYHLRALVTLLRSHGEPLDYGRLAKDLYRLQDARTANGVRLAWGRDLHRGPQRTDHIDRATDQAARPATETGVL